jgi:hypothetical protein
MMRRRDLKRSAVRQLQQLVVLDLLRERQRSAAVILARSDDVVDGADDPVYGTALAATWAWLHTCATDDVVDFGVEALPGTARWYRTASRRVARAGEPRPRPLARRLEVAVSTQRSTNCAFRPCHRRRALCGWTCVCYTIHARWLRGRRNRLHSVSIQTFFEGCKS